MREEHSKELLIGKQRNAKKDPEHKRVQTWNDKHACISHAAAHVYQPIQHAMQAKKNPEHKRVQTWNYKHAKVDTCMHASAMQQHTYTSPYNRPCS